MPRIMIIVPPSIFVWRGEEVLGSMINMHVMNLCSNSINQTPDTTLGCILPSRHQLGSPELLNFDTDIVMDTQFSSSTYSILHVESTLLPPALSHLKNQLNKLPLLQLESFTTKIFNLFKSLFCENLL